MRVPEGYAERCSVALNKSNSKTIHMRFSPFAIAVSRQERWWGVRFKLIEVFWEPMVHVRLIHCFAQDRCHPIWAGRMNSPRDVSRWVCWSRSG